MNSELKGMSRNSFIKFLYPSFAKKSILRMAATIIVAYVFFAYICIPLRIQGFSMEPGYRTGSINFCWRLAYWFSEPRVSDIVFVRLAGRKIMLMKRVVALEGDTVEFRSGKLVVNGKQFREPYVKYPCNWELSCRKVKTNHVYLVGDNRNVPMEQHDFGQTLGNRIVGAPIW